MKQQIESHVQKYEYLVHLKITEKCVKRKKLNGPKLKLVSQKNL